MIKFICLLSAMLILHSCSSERKVEENAFVIDYNETTMFKWDEIIDIEEVIPLETNNSCLLSYANKCIVSDNRIVYSDSKQRALYVFDRKGNFIYAIDALGAGNAEYTMIKDVIVSQNKLNIMILDNTSILVFDLADGAYIDRISLDKKYASSFYQFADAGNDRFYFWSIEPDSSLYVLDKGCLYPIRERSGFPFVCQKFYRDDKGKLNLISDCGQYSIETITGDSLTTKYSFDFGSFAFPYDKSIKTVSEWESIDDKPYFKSLLSAYETKDVLYTTTATPNRNIYCIAVKKDTLDIFCGNQNVDAPVVVIGSDDSSFYGILYPASFVEDNDISNLIGKYDISDDDNPLLIRFKFNFSRF